ncbi:MAG TPA: transketolase [Gaiellaceae bacterium]|nr:transketolase [Gaiellaceae bacterium]
MATTDIERLSIDTIRTLAMDSVQKANAGHPGTAMALAPLAYLLYAEVMRHSPANPDWPDRDRFVLSAGHACVLQYAALHLAGYDLTLDDLKQFRQWGSRTPGHPEVHHTPGIEVTTGPLGQGFANGVGFGIAESFLAERYNRPYDEIVDHRVYCICGDGDMMEGVSNEAASIAGTLGLGKLIYFYDDNRITIDGTTSISFFGEDKGARVAAQGWHVQNVADVNDLDALREAIANAQAETERPSLIVVRSHIAYPAPHAMDTAKAHGAPLGEVEVRATKEALGWDPDQSFVVPDEVRAHMDVRARGAALEEAWRGKLDAWSAKYPELREDWDQVQTGRPRAGWTDALPSFTPGDEVATRDAGAKVMEAFKHHVPTMIGGAADLVESTKTEFKGGGVFSASHAGRNIAFGIREHAMGSIVNAIGLHGGTVKPYGSTFLIFSDYMRPAVRLSALSGIPVVWAWTHDSVGLGEDGPTHQPVEHYAALRAIPNFWFVRPADATETVGAWKVALEREDGPVGLALSRQKLPVLEHTHADGVARGAYVIWESEEANGVPDLILLASGSEVHVALEAARRLDGEGVHGRVVSMPCWELFEAQTQGYRDQVLPPDVKARVSVEAGVELGWSKWVGDEGDSISIERFGASAPGGTVLAELGVSVDNVVTRALALRERVSG